MAGLPPRRRSMRRRSQAVGVGEGVIWSVSHRFDPEAAVLADRHYSRRKVGSPQFVPPGRCLVLSAPFAYWVTSWPFAEYTRHAWAGAWICSAFRREGGDVPASAMIRDAVAATRARYGDPPPMGMITFIDRTKVPPLHTRKGDVWGRTYRLAGFVDAGETKGGLLALQLWPNAMPAPERAIGAQLGLFGTTA